MTAPPSLAELDVFVVCVTDFADGGAATNMNFANFSTRKS
jgi:hypothetical protein